MPSAAEFESTPFYYFFCQRYLSDGVSRDEKLLGFEQIFDISEVGGQLVSSKSMYLTSFHPITFFIYCNKEQL